MRWEELRLADTLWLMPPERTKNYRPHTTLELPERAERTL
jgi:hypothetical protein